MATQPRESPGEGGRGSSTRVVLVDDHALFRAGLSDLLTARGYAIAGEAATAEEAVAAVADGEPDVAIVDVALPDKGGIWAAGEIRASSPACRVLMLSASATTEHVIAAVQVGACGYLLKDASADEIAGAVSAAARGDSVLSPALTGAVLEWIRGENALVGDPRQDAGLTARELAVLRELVAGKGNREIAAELTISVQTVKSHVSHLLEKLEVDNRIQAAVAAVRNRLV